MLCGITTLSQHRPLAAPRLTETVREPQHPGVHHGSGSRLLIIKRLSKLEPGFLHILHLPDAYAPFVIEVRGTHVRPGVRRRLCLLHDVCRADMGFVRALDRHHACRSSEWGGTEGNLTVVLSTPHPCQGLTPFIHLPEHEGLKGPVPVQTQILYIISRASRPPFAR